MEEIRVTHSINIRSSLLHKCNIAAVAGGKSMGQWLEEAIMEKIDRERRPAEKVKGRAGGKRRG